MRARLPQYPRSLPVWLSVAIWLAVFLSPVSYFLLLMIAARWQVPAPAGKLAFCLDVDAKLLSSRANGHCDAVQRVRPGTFSLALHVTRPVSCRDSEIRACYRI